jgi:hypothetical protein
MNYDGANLWGDYNMFHIPYINYICETYKQPKNELKF